MYFLLEMWILNLLLDFFCFENYKAPKKRQNQVLFSYEDMWAEQPPACLAQSLTVPKHVQEECKAYCDIFPEYCPNIMR